ncbi:MAG: anaerobic ribonucleoside-triphosphate reductase activating protein [Clostridia bacterium]|nr:anaerobic ribonucleoside-triphosphate reductase activating protein [Clostridia bacterium]
MNYGEIKKSDIANGPGVRVSLFVSGCTNCCEGCFQPETWDFNFGKLFDGEAKMQIFNELSKSYVRGITLLGGDPFEPSNQEELLPLLKQIRDLFPSKDVWCYTGLTLASELHKAGSHPRCDYTDEMLKCIDVLVDGRFVLAEKDISLRFRGSRNQRLIDMNKTRETGEIVLWDDGTGKGSL